MSFRSGFYLIAAVLPLAVISLAGGARAEETRTWSSGSGNYKTEAEFVQLKVNAIHKAGDELADLTPEELAEMGVEERTELLKLNIARHMKDFVERYTTGDPSEGFTSEEAIAYLREMRDEMSPAEFRRALQVSEQKRQAADFKMLLNIDNVYAVGISKHLVRQQSLGSQKGPVPVHHVLGSLLDPQSRQYPSVGAVLKQ